VDRLFGDLELIGNLGRSPPVERRMAEHRDVKQVMSS
jgi:hypothetical protein